MSTPSNSLSQLALQKFKKNFWGVFSLCFIIAVGIIAVFAYAFAPDNSQNANQMHVSIASKGPGFSTTMLVLPSQIEHHQNFVDALFFGEKNTTTEIPITSYSMSGNTIHYIEYASDGLIGLSLKPF